MSVLLSGTRVKRAMRREVESVVVDGLSLDARVSETGQWKALRDLAITATDSNKAQRW